MLLDQTVYTENYTGKFINIRQKQPPEMFYKKGALKNLAMFTAEHLRWSLFLMKLRAFWSAT